MFPSSSLPHISLSKHKMSILRTLGTLQHWMGAHLSCPRRGKGCVAHLSDTAQAIWKSVSFRRSGSHKVNIHIWFQIFRLRLEYLFNTKHINHTYLAVCILKKSFHPVCSKLSVQSRISSASLPPEKKFFCLQFDHETACTILIPKVMIPFQPK